MRPSKIGAYPGQGTRKDIKSVTHEGGRCIDGACSCIDGVGSCRDGAVNCLDGVGNFIDAAE